MTQPWARYTAPDGTERGYTVPDACGACGAALTRGCEHMCYRCLGYFCAAHLVTAAAPVECFAGWSRQVCVGCRGGG